ncbi:MAG: aminotransferase class I/II-fold pyridoxal phosphate-dependent enzyme, partial [Bacteroidia bacterium]|nr:aminotransferase class I/II-fold pyridoxal phosphate-dependent enzyme [Bacteroidia bacterium]
VGYMAGPLWLAKACDKIQGQVTSGTCSIAQKAALAALIGGRSDTQKMAGAYLKRRDLVLNMLQEIEGVKTYVPQGAFYIFPDVSHYFGTSDGQTQVQNADDLCMYLLNEAYVALVTGSAFGAPNCIRISYAASEDELREAIHRIKDALAKLKA